MGTNLPANRESDQQPVWMIVADASSETEAAVIVGRLRSLGIPAIIHNESPLAAIGISFGAKVAVPEAYYDAAMLVLNPDDSIPLLEDDLDDEDGGDNGYDPDEG